MPNYKIIQGKNRLAKYPKGVKWVPYNIQINADRMLKSLNSHHLFEGWWTEGKRDSVSDGWFIIVEDPEPEFNEYGEVCP